MQGKMHSLRKASVGNLLACNARHGLASSYIYSRTTSANGAYSYHKSSAVALAPTWSHTIIDVVDTQIPYIDRRKTSMSPFNIRSPIRIRAVKRIPLSCNDLLRRRVGLYLSVS